MKVFISWSGDLSQKVAEVMRDWLPNMMDNIQVFFSPIDIEKGENWEQRISVELSKSNYGIICLTPENVAAPWVNFEAGAIAKALNSRLTAILIDLNPSDLQGPISRYESVIIEKEDLFRLFQSINKQADPPIDEGVLQTRFDALWSSVNNRLQTILQEKPDSTKNTKKTNERTSSKAVEEVLQLVRKQDSLMSSPEKLIPKDYIINIIREYKLAETKLLIENYLNNRTKYGKPKFQLYTQIKKPIQQNTESYIIPSNLEDIFYDSLAKNNKFVELLCRSGESDNSLCQDQADTDQMETASAEKNNNIK